MSWLPQQPHAGSGPEVYASGVVQSGRDLDGIQRDAGLVDQVLNNITSASRGVRKAVQGL